MSFAHQVLDVAVAAALAGVTTYLLAVVVPEQAVTVGVMLASAYYFSRNPWGAPDGAAYNDRIDEFYDRVLPSSR